MIEIDWRCHSCGIDTDAIDEYYMLHNAVWDQVHGGNPEIQLCLGCVEHRLGRTLTPADFTDAEVNSTAKLKRSPRLQSRLKSQHPSTDGP